VSRNIRCHEPTSHPERDCLIALNSKAISEFTATGIIGTIRCKPWRQSIELPCVTALVFAISARSQQPRAYKLEGDINGAHDPSIAREGKTYYVITTGKASDGGQLGIRCSEDLVHWRNCGQVFDNIPPWIKERSPGTKKPLGSRHLPRERALSSLLRLLDVWKEHFSHRARDQ
jgi:hypothetical protein